MPNEIERRFLITGLPPATVIPPPNFVVQAYEEIDAARGYERRIRLWQSPNGTVSFKRTVKEGRGLSRSEDQQPITIQAFFAGLLTAVGRPIVKHIYELPHGERTIEIHRSLSHEPLVIVEVEFPSLETAAAFEPPDWFGYEVTDNIGYNSQSIALHGVPFNHPAPPDHVLRQLTASPPTTLAAPNHGIGC